MNKNYRDPENIISSLDTEEDVDDSVLDESDSEPIASTSELVVNESNTAWSENDLVELKEWRKHHADKLAEVEEIIIKGYSEIKCRPKPKRTLEQITGKKNINYKSKSSKNVSKKPKIVIDWKNMNSIEFGLIYLKTFLKSNTSDNESEDNQTEMPTDDVAQMGEFLKYQRIKDEKDETLLLKKKLQLGNYLIIAKGRYLHYKIQTKCKETWDVWLWTTTGINDKSAQQYTSLAELVRQYPKLGQLNISFTRMREMIPKIKKVFIENQSVGSYWKEI